MGGKGSRDGEADRGRRRDPRGEPPAKDGFPDDLDPPMTVRESSSGEKPDLDWLLLFAAWMLTLLATAGSLFFSNVMEFAPCVLCWYQRICLFPLVVILARGLLPFDRGAVR